MYPHQQQAQCDTCNVFWRVVNRLQSSDQYWTEMMTEMARLMEVFKSEDNHSDDCARRLRTSIVPQRPQHRQQLESKPFSMSNRQQQSSPFPIGALDSSISILVPNETIFDILKNHIKTLTWKCLQANCSSIVTSHGALVVHHLKKHHRRPYLCLAQGCKKSFESRSILKDHLLQEHSNERRWICKCKLKCQFEIGELDKIILHQQLFHEEGQFRCDSGGCHFEPQSIRWPVVEHFLQQHHGLQALQNYN